MANHWDIEIEQGSTFARTLTITKNGSVLNLTNYTALWQIRTSQQAVTALVELTQASGLTLGGTAGTITLLLSSTATGLLAFIWAVHELRLTDPDGNVLPRLRGNVRLTPYIAR